MKQRVFHVIQRILPWLIVAVLALLAVHISYKITAENERLEQEKQNAVKQETPTVNVITLLLQPSPLSDSITLPAEIIPEQEVLVKAEVSGLIVETLADEGAKLKKGQRILKPKKTRLPWRSNAL
jgi:multidrug efflux pump subunit AcrA (membrane-fusion protein)